MIDRWPGHNFSVAARSLLIGEFNLGLPRDFNGLRVAKISRFATSALTAGKQALYCMRRADFCDRGKPLQSRFIQLCARCISNAGDPIKPLLREDIFSVRRSMPSARHASPRPGAHCSGTTAVVSLTRSSVPREVDGCSIQVTSFFAALSLSSLDRYESSRLLLPRSGLERSDFVPWPIATFRCEAEFGRHRGHSGRR